MPAESRSDELFLNDMVRSCEKILRFTAGLQAEDFFADEKTYDAVLRNPEIIGEAAKHISDRSRAKLANIEWRKIAAFRDIVAHQYFGIDKDILWDIVRNKVPQLQTQLGKVPL
jgi:uncharacterized protein with HEPN domain